MPRSPYIDAVPAGPPPEVLAEVDAAWERAQELCDGEPALHFEVDAGTGRVRGVLREPGGEIRERISAYDALMMACGEPAAAAAPALVA